MQAPDWIVSRPIAHRGLHDAKRSVIENTVGAALAAVAGKFAIECDVQLTADGEAVVFHDFTLERLTAASGRVDQHSAAALSAIPMRATSDRIVTLQSFLEIIGGQAGLVCEIKSRFDGDMRLTRRVAEIVNASNAPVVLKSFDPRVIIALRTLTPRHARGIVAMLDYSYPDYESCTADEKKAMANLLHFEESRPDFISWRVRDLPTAAPFLCRKGMGLPVMAWTVRTAGDRALAAAHADQMVFEGFTP